MYIYIYVSFRISESPTGLRLQDVDRDLCPWVSHVMDPQVLVEPRLCPRMALVFRQAERPNFKMATEVITNHQTLGENSRKKHRKRSKIIKLWGKLKKKTSKTISKKIKLWGKLKKKTSKTISKKIKLWGKLKKKTSKTISKKIKLWGKLKKKTSKTISKKIKHHQTSMMGMVNPMSTAKPGMFVFDLSIFRPQCALEFFGCRWVWRPQSSFQKSESRDLNVRASRTRLSTAFSETVTLSGTRFS